MKLAGRIGFYLGGFALGLLLLFFFLGGKNASCDYGPTARVLKTLRSKRMVLSPESRQQLTLLEQDSAQLVQLLIKGDVLFGQSEPRKEPCGHYLVESTDQNIPLRALFENCPDSVVVRAVTLLKD